MRHLFSLLDLFDDDCFFVPAIVRDDERNIEDYLFASGIAKKLSVEQVGRLFRLQNLWGNCLQSIHSIVDCTVLFLRRIPAFLVFQNTNLAKCALYRVNLFGVQPGKPLQCGHAVDNGFACVSYPTCHLSVRQLQHRKVVKLDPFLFVEFRHD